MRSCFCCTIVLLAACAKTERPPAVDTTAAAQPAPPPAPAPISLADVAGKWTLRTMPARLEQLGDLLAPALALRQELPRRAAA